MEDWSQEQLEKVIADKHAKEKTNATSIICKHFLDAVEKKQYGWCADVQLGILLVCCRAVMFWQRMAHVTAS